MLICWFSKSKLFSKGHWGYFSITDPPISILMTIHLIVSMIQRRVAVYDVPHASSSDDNWVYPCCGLFKLEKWEVHYHSCADIIQPYRWQLLESETSFCDICHKNCTSPADFVFHQERVHLCLPLFVCPICHFTDITRSCLCMHITESHGGLETAIFFNLRFRKLFLSCYSIISMM